jgi:hypothetical protein
MSRRRPKGELQFGSDSFLDVVANIVGILIILIVIAGLRVSQSPVVLGSSKATEETSSEAKAPVDSSGGGSDEDGDSTQLSIPIAEVEKPVRPPLPELVIPPELIDLTGSLQAEIDRLKDADADLSQELNQATLTQQELLERQKAIRLMLSKSAEEVDANQKQAKAQQIDLELARETLLRLSKQVEELEDKPINLKTLEHKVTPIGRIVNGREKHYRLSKNRVAEVPVDELVGRLKEQIERRKEWLAKTRQHQGVIGPVQGFRMQYLVRIESLSGLEELRTGHGGYRISLSNWEIQPEPETKGETIEVALKKGSQFYQSILGAAPDTTLTFWVYPDSYEIYRKLQKFTHDHGFSVSGRPLPNGVPISGSPQGSKSSSQ